VYKRALEMGTSLYGGLAGLPRIGLICWGLCVENVSGRGVYLHGSPVGKLGRGCPSTGKFEN